MTTWKPLNDFNHRSWILRDGSVALAPDLEQTPAGRRIRIKGTTASFSRNDAEQVLYSGVQMAAAARGTEIWMPAPTTGAESAVPIERYASATLHLVTDGLDTTYVWWRYRHETAPIEAILWISFTGEIASSTRRDCLHIRSGLTYLAVLGSDQYTRTTWLNETDWKFSRLARELGSYYSPSPAVKELVNKHPYPFSSINMDERSDFSSPRIAVAEVLKRVRAIEALDHIAIPDVHGNSASWLDLILVDTNVNGEFLSTLIEYLDSAPSVDQAANAYKEMVKYLRQAGLNLESLEGDTLMDALLNKNATLDLVVSANGENGTIDHDHTITINLKTGAVVVNCSLRHADRDDVATKWDEAITLASLTGQEDELLAFARKYAEEAREARKARVLAECAATSAAALA